MKRAKEESDRDFDDILHNYDTKLPKQRKTRPTSTSSTSIAVEAVPVAALPAASVIPEALPATLPAIDPALPAIDPPPDVHSVQPIDDAVPMSIPSEAPGASAYTQPDTQPSISDLSHLIETGALNDIQIPNGVFGEEDLMDLEPIGEGDLELDGP